MTFYSYFLEQNHIILLATGAKTCSILSSLIAAYRYELVISCKVQVASPENCSCFIIYTVDTVKFQRLWWAVNFFFV